MYVPRHFSLDDDRLAALFAGVQSAQLVTATEAGPVATLLPVFHRPEPGEHGSFIAHMSRVNPQWRQEVLGEALLILNGPDGYISTRWMPEVSEAGTAVPTWNYVTAHVYGRLVVHDDEEWVRAAVTALATRKQPEYDLDKLDPAYVRGQFRAVIGLELMVTRVEAKAKLSQNKSPRDVAGIMAGLEATGSHDLAAEVRCLALPYSQQRAELVSRVRERRQSGTRPGSGS